MCVNVRENIIYLQKLGFAGARVPAEQYVDVSSEPPVTCVLEVLP